MAFPFSFGLDPLSKIALHHFSFFLKYYFPTERLDEIQGKHELSMKMNRISDRLNKGRVPSGEGFIFTGSAAEGLSLPPIQDRQGIENEVRPSDIDVMIVLPQNLAYAKRDMVLDDKVYATVKPSHHIGFFNLSSNQTGKKLTFATFEAYQDWELAVRMKEMRGNFVFPMAHGPAFTEKMDNIEVDFVYCLKIKEWPLQATSWLTRPRSNGWPSDMLVQAISSTGIHVVPIGYPCCQKSLYEWRISFSEAEKMLAHSITLCQKKVYIILKLLHRQFLSHPSILATYHLKTTLFWTIENSPSSVWCENKLAYCLLILLDQLYAFLKQRAIPNFFIPECNLIATADELFIETLEKKVLAIRLDPFKSLLELDEEFQISYVPSKMYSWMDLLDKELKENLITSQILEETQRQTMSVEQQVQEQAKQEKDALGIYQDIVEKLVIIGCDDQHMIPPHDFILSLLKDAYSYFISGRITGKMEMVTFINYVQAIFEIEIEALKQSTVSHLFVENQFYNIAYFLYQFAAVNNAVSLSEKDQKALGLIFHRAGILMMMVVQYDPSKLKNQFYVPPRKRVVNKDELLRDTKLCFETSMQLLENDPHLVLSYIILLWIKSKYQQLIDLCVSNKELFNLDYIILTIHAVDVIIYEDSLQEIIHSELDRNCNAESVGVAEIDCTLLICYYFSLAHLKLNKYLNSLFVQSFTDRCIKRDKFGFDIFHKMTEEVIKAGLFRPALQLFKDNQ